jgi:hypothetical protein
MQIDTMTTAQLVAEYNRLCPEKPVKKFSDRATAIKRVTALLGKAAPAPAKAPTSPEASAPAATPTPAPKPVKRSSEAAPKAEEPSGAPRSAKSEYKANKAGKEPRPESKRGQLAALLRGPGITIEEMMAKFEWKVTDCRDALRLIGAQNGIATKLGDDGKWRAM